MRFVESILVGVPLFWFLFFVVMMATGNANHFNSETGQTIMDDFYGNCGNVSTIEELEDCNLNNNSRVKPVLNASEGSGVVSFFSATQSGWGFITTMIELEWDIISLPMHNVAGESQRADVQIFNNLFWALIVAPSHMLLVFAFLFFLRSG